MDDMPSFHLQAARIRTCAPAWALTQVSAEYMRQWYIWMPGMLFRYGCVCFPEELPQIYMGGLSEDQHLFVLVPEDLFKMRRRLLLEQARSFEEKVTLSVDQALQVHSRAYFALEEEARRVAYWRSLLAIRQIPQTSDWRWGPTS